MSLCTMKELLESAQRQNRAVGAFSVGNMEMVAGAVKAAEQSKTPIILQIAQVRFPYSPLHLMGPMMIEAAQNASVKIAVHLDHGTTMDAVQAALDYGFTSVMFDGSLLPFEENVMKTSQVKKMADRFGATVEAELGIVGGSEDGGKSHGIRCTDPAEVPEFCRRTGVDALAVAIGNAHGNYPVAPALYFDVLEKIRQVSPAYLVLHGGSGISDLDFRKSIEHGIRKINIATASFQALTCKAEAYFTTQSGCDYFGLNEKMVEGVYENVLHHIMVFNNKEDLQDAVS